MPSSEESRLIAEAQAGSADAFEELVRRYDRRVLRLALRFVRSDEEARDVYQEAFLKVYRSLGKFRRDSRFETWLFRIVTNVCIDHLRRVSARPPASPAIRETGDDREPDEMRIADSHPESDPERSAASRELRDRIATGLAGLAPRERLVFEMRHYEGMRLREIGEILECSEETAKNCLFRAHRKMRRSLRDIGGVGFQRIGGDINPARAGI